MSNELRIVDLFAGIGGLSGGVEEALQRSGYTAKVVFTSEIKSAARTVLATNHPDRHIHGDITKIAEKDIPAHDILLAGFPCQAFSHAGARKGFEDATKGTLFFDVLRILKHHRPSYFILENVEGILTHDKTGEFKNQAYGNTFNVILASLKEAGYEVSWELLEATDFGVPQRRKRVFIVGTRLPSGDWNEALNKYRVADPSKVTISKIISKGHREKDPKVREFAKLMLKSFTPDQLEGRMLRDKRNSSFYIHSWDFGARGECSDDEKAFLDVFSVESRKRKWAKLYNIRYQEGMALHPDDIKTFYEHKDLPAILASLTTKGYLRKETHNGYEGYRMMGGLLSYPITHILSPDKPAPTLTATDSSRMVIVDGEGLRRFRRKELKKLFGFKPGKLNLTGVPDNKVFDLLGNTVIPPVAEAAMLALLDTTQR